MRAFADLRLACSCVRQRYFGGSSTEYAIANSVTVFVGGMTSSFAGGWLADKWAVRSAKVGCRLQSCLPTLPIC